MHQCDDQCDDDQLDEHSDEWCELQDQEQEDLYPEWEYNEILH